MTITLPLRTYSLANQREHWAKKAKRTKAERKAAYMACPRVSLPCIVTLTRIAPRELDTDNLTGALKAVRDGVADRLGIDDADRRVWWMYAQRSDAPKTYGVEIHIQRKRDNGEE